MTDESGKGNGSAGSGDQSTGTIDIGGNKFTADDIKTLQETATKAQQTAKGITEAAAKYEMDSGGYIDQAEGAFAIVGRLVQEGIINSEGELVTKKKEEGKADPLDGLFGEPKGKPAGDEESKVSEIVAKAMGTMKDEFSEQVDGLKKDNSQLFRLLLERDVQKDFPDLSQEEISQAIGKAAHDPKKRGVKHQAEGILKAKGSYRSAVEKEVLEKYGINQEEWEAKNKMKEQGAEGGASAMVKGKKLSFTKKGDDYVHPRDATKEYLDNAI